MASTIKVNNVQASDGGNIVNQCGTTITLGASGDTINLASGASQTGFGRTGTVDWQTGSIKTGTFTAANGEGYFANTSGGAFTMNLPAGVVGNIVSVVDYSNTFATYNLTITPNGSDKIGGYNQDATLSTDGQSVTFVYVDAAEGWKNTMDSTSAVTGIPPYITATGGTISNTPTCQIHTFTGPGTFEVTRLATCAADNALSYMVVAGGGGGGWEVGGGGGAGGFRELSTPVAPYTASPLDGYPTPGNRIVATVTSYPITVGGGGTGGDPGGTYPSPSQAPSGSNSIFSTITSTGGGGAGNYNATPGANGGSGGGGAGISSPSSGGSGNTPSVTPAQGTAGGTGGVGPTGGGGGGGATAAGVSSSCTPPSGHGPRAAGATTEITASPVAYAQGGRGSSDPAPGPCGQAGGNNTGTGGDGGGATPVLGKAGGSGIVIIRYKFQ